MSKGARQIPLEVMDPAGDGLAIRAIGHRYGSRRETERKPKAFRVRRWMKKLVRFFEAIM